MKKIISTSIIVLFFTTVTAQDNSLYIINFLQRRIDSVAATPVSALSSAKTSSSYGGAGNDVLQMPLNLQSAQWCNNSSITIPQKVSTLGPITSYPARTVLKLGRMSNGVFNPMPVMAVMIGDRFALTDHGLINEVFRFGFPPVIPAGLQLDSIVVWPSYENGTSAFAELAPVRIIKLYHFKTLILGSIRNFSLLELEQPLGNFTGWQAIGFNNDDDFFSNRNFQKLSLPFESLFPSGYSKGDTMYHRYGRATVFGNDFTTLGGGWGVNYIGPALGFINNGFENCVTGLKETGSPLFYTNNTDSCIMYALCGTMPNSFFHSRITPDVFSAFSKIITNTNTSVNNINPNLFLVYPNPVTHELFIKSNHPISYELRIINTNGQTVMQQQNFNQGRITMNGLPAGVYFVQLRNKKEILTKKIVKQ